MKKKLTDSYKAGKARLDKITGKALEQQFEKYCQMIETILSGISAKLDEQVEKSKQIDELETKIQKLEKEISAQKTIIEKFETELITIKNNTGLQAPKLMHGLDLCFQEIKSLKKLNQGNSKRFAINKSKVEKISLFLIALLCIINAGINFYILFKL